jgi:hypothetical protein
MFQNALNLKTLEIVSDLDPPAVQDFGRRILEFGI